MGMGKFTDRELGIISHALVNLADSANSETVDAVGEDGETEYDFRDRVYALEEKIWE